MKKTTLTLIIALSGFHAFAQDYGEPISKKEHKEKKITNTKPGKCSKIYYSISSGINNNTGIIGFGLDIPVAASVSVEGGIGVGTWGYKLCGAGKYYLQPCHRGWAFGGGVTYCTGLQGFQKDMETIYGNTEPVQLDINPQTNVFIAAYRYLNIGRKYNRFYIELGWSVRLPNGNLFDQTNGNQISDNSRAAITFISPGRLIAAIGFSFGNR